MTEPEPDIPKINLYQKQRLCFVVSDMGDEFLVELSPKRKSRYKTKSYQSISLSTGKPEKVGRTHGKSQDQGIKIDLTLDSSVFLEVFKNIDISDLKTICFHSIKDNPNKRDGIRKIAEQDDMAMELIAYHERLPRSLQLFLRCILDRKDTFKIGYEIHKEHIRKANK